MAAGNNLPTPAVPAYALGWRGLQGCRFEILGSNGGIAARSSVTSSNSVRLGPVTLPQRIALTSLSLEAFVFQDGYEYVSISLVSPYELLYLLNLLLDLDLSNGK